MRYLLHGILASGAVLCGSAGLASAAPDHSRATYPRQAAIYAGLQNGLVYRSTDGGYSWEERDTGLPSGDVLSLAAGRDGTLFAGLSGSGVYRSTDGGASWHDDNGGRGDLAQASITALATGPGSSPSVYAATTDGAIYVGFSNGQNWDRSAINEQAVSSLAVDQTRPGVLLAGAESGGMYISTRFGLEWQQASGIPAYDVINKVVFDPRNGDVAYAATAEGVYQSVDGGQSWQAENNGIPYVSDIQALAVDPRNGARVLAVTSDGQVYRTTDGASSWSNISSTGGSGITAALFDPAATGHVLVASMVYNQIYLGDDAGSGWQSGSVGGDTSNGVLCLAAADHQVLPTDPEPAVSTTPYVRYFPGSHHSVSGPFLSFYNHYTGLKVFGLPLTGAFVENGQLVQYFERVRLVLQGSTVRVSQLGRQITAGRYFPPVAPFRSTPARLYFAATGHALSGRFLSFWKTHSGPALFGQPISEPLREQNGDGTGRTYLVQYFENARMEYHPELSGTGYQVSLGLLGKQYLKQMGLL